MAGIAALEKIWTEVQGLFKKGELTDDNPKFLQLFGFKFMLTDAQLSQISAIRLDLRAAGGSTLGDGSAYSSSVSSIMPAITRASGISRKSKSGALAGNVKAISDTQCSESLGAIEDLIRLG